MTFWRQGGLALSVVTMAAATILAAAPASAATTTLTVRESGEHGWTFNSDPATSTPYEFSTAQATEGAGSLYVPPITNSHNGGGDQFVANLAGGFPTSAFEYFAVDMKAVVAPGATLSISSFFVRVDVNLPGSTTSYDCRYTVGMSGNGDPAYWNAGVGFSKAAADFGVPGALTDQPDDGFTCPSNPFFSSMPAGSTVRQFSVHVGDSSTADTGNGAYIDSPYLALYSAGAWDERFYDFEPYPDSDGDGLTDNVDPDGVAALLPSALAAYARPTASKVFRSELDKVEQLLLVGDVAAALDKLDALRHKVDGCAPAAKPRSDRDDWIVDCDAQIAVRAALDSVIAALRG